MTESIDFSSYPPSPVTWAYNALDSICEPLGCGQWRQMLPSRWTTSGAWLSDDFRMGPVTKLFPKLTTYEEFLEHNNLSNSAQSLTQFAFETPSTSLADLTTPSSLLSLFLLVLILRQLKGILLPLFSDLGRSAARHTHGPAWEKTNEIRIVKFGEYVFRLLFHSCISMAGIYYFWDKEWWKTGGASYLFQNYPHQDIAPGMAWYYLVQCSYNVDAMVSLLEMSFDFQPNTAKGAILPYTIGWSKAVRGDFREMFIHHIVTNLLIVGSSFFRFTRVGSMVFLVHDISDVPVDLSKLANFLKWKTATALCFANMVLIWCLTRLGILPFVIYKAVLTESWLVCQSGVIDPIYYVHYKPFFVVLIGLLIVLHLAWFTMFLQMGWVLISKGEAHDLSEHKKGEDQSSSDGSKTTASSSPKKKSA